MSFWKIVLTDREIMIYANCFLDLVEYLRKLEVIPDIELITKIETHITQEVESKLVLKYKYMKS